MPKYLDLANWARRDLFEFFLGFDKPYFNICARLDITNLLALLRRRSNVSVSLAYHYFALRIANEIEPFRYRLREGKVIVHDVINGGTTVLPWVSFTSFSHARNWGREDSVPRIAFGKFTKENDRTLLPISVEVHHALMD